MKRRRFLSHVLKGALWVPAAPYILRGQQLTVDDPVLMSQYNPYASAFDGTNDYMTRGGVALVGTADSSVGTVSLWFKITGSDSVSIPFFIMTNPVFASAFEVVRSSANVIRVRSYEEAGTKHIEIVSNIQYKVATNPGWHHLFTSWDLNVPLTYLYVDGVDRQTVTLANAGLLWLRETNVAIGGYPNGTNLAPCLLAEIYFDRSNFRNTSAITLFRTPNGRPANIPANIASGALANPIIYMRNPHYSFGTNSGTGGNFTVTGALDNATPP